ncbi:MAG: mannose-6-phosphate isomerase, class I [Desulfobacterales bacterium]|nr:MAG: mannose-6-phosphate isomerase, class I [Desulfobacterales bacterium]
MKTIGTLKNTVQHYAWGSPASIPELLGEENPSGRPWAELWMGAHPKAPSLVNYQGRWVSLKELIEKHPHHMLGYRVVDKFNSSLPYLFKILAAAKPLSIQAHPSLSQAKAGFEEENRLRIPLDAPQRNFKDDNHKPECICALSKFHALFGFRQVSEIVAMMSAGCPVELSDELKHLKKKPDSQAIKQFFIALMKLDPRRQKRVINETLQNLSKLPDRDIRHWVKRLSIEYPSDIGILSPILLNLICLEPGQALFLPAGELHAYLEGLGIELMANSDNVLRGGLTPKHIDIPQLLNVVHFDPRAVNIRTAVEKGENEKIYVTPAEEFVLSSICVSDKSLYESSASRSLEILLCIDGKASIKDIGTMDIFEIKKGGSLMIPAAVNRYTISGNAVFYKAAVPI